MGNPKKDKSKKMKLIVSNWFLIIYLNSTSLDTGLNNFLKLQWELENNRITVFLGYVHKVPLLWLLNSGRPIYVLKLFQSIGSICENLVSTISVKFCWVYTIFGSLAAWALEFGPVHSMCFSIYLSVTLMGLNLLSNKYKLESQRSTY